MQWRGPLGLLCMVVTGGALYGIGYWHGQASLPPSVAPEAAQHEPLANPRPQQTSTEFADLLHAKAWFKLERWLAEHARTVTLDHGRQLHAALSSNLNKYDALSMRRVLRAYLDLQPQDTRARFLLSDLQTMSGLTEAALESLFQVLDYPASEEDVVQAEQAAGSSDHCARHSLQEQGRTGGTGRILAAPQSTTPQQRLLSLPLGRRADRPG